MGAEKRGDNFQRLIAVQFALEGEDPQFAGDVQTVAAFGLDGGGAIGSEFFKEGESALFQGIVGRGAKFFYGVENASAFAGNLFVAGALDFELIFFGAAGSVNEVGMRVDEAGKDNAAANIDFFGLCGVFVGFNLFARTNCDYAVVANQEGALFYDAEIRERRTAPRCAAAQG